MITIKSPLGGFVAIVPVSGCANCPFLSMDNMEEDVCGHDGLGKAVRDYAVSSGLTRDPSWHPDWCPAIAESWDNLPGTADLDFQLNDAIESLKGGA